jgi:ElaB/YqjD/DUF883 family membrane-anchored ribosome-binding protein
MENQVNTLTEEKTPEQIEAEMFETRESLSEKVVALENQVVGTVQNAANTLTNTVDAVKSFVKTAPDTVSDTVEQVATAVRERVEKTFDIGSRVQNNPWGSVGVSLGLGFLAGYLFFPARSSSSAPKPESRIPPPLPTEDRFRPMAPSPEPGLLDELFGMLAKKVKEMTENVIDSAAVAMNKNIRESVPKLIDDATKKMVGENNRESADQSFDAGKRIYGR